MIVAKLQGGLGNQMFQYAAARSLQIKNEPVLFYLDFFAQQNQNKDQFTTRKYELGIFKNLKGDPATKKEINFFKSNSGFYKLQRFIKKPLFISQDDNEYIFKALPKSDCVYLNGYFQSEKHFIHIKKQLVKELEFPQLDAINLAHKEKMETSNSVSIHIRRGDYLKPLFLNVHGILPQSYYYTALNKLRLQYSDLRVFIFSDDIEIIKNEFDWQNADVSYISQNQIQDSWKDMALMTCCKHHIIANSSFSWWGAWLSSNNKNTYAPVNWFNSSVVKYDIHDFVPAGWNIINYE